MGTDEAGNWVWRTDNVPTGSPLPRSFVSTPPVPPPGMQYIPAGSVDVEDIRGVSVDAFTLSLIKETAQTILSRDLARQSQTSILDTGPSILPEPEVPPPTALSPRLSFADKIAADLRTGSGQLGEDMNAAWRALTALDADAFTSALFAGRTRSDAAAREQMEQVRQSSFYKQLAKRSPEAAEAPARLSLAASGTFADTIGVPFGIIGWVMEDAIRAVRGAEGMAAFESWNHNFARPMAGFATLGWLAIMGDAPGLLNAISASATKHVSYGPGSNLGQKLMQFSGGVFDEAPEPLVTDLVYGFYEAGNVLPELIAPGGTFSGSLARGASRAARSGARASVAGITTMNELRELATVRALETATSVQEINLSILTGRGLYEAAVSRAAEFSTGLRSAMLREANRLLDGALPDFLYEAVPVQVPEALDLAASPGPGAVPVPGHVVDIQTSTGPVRGLVVDTTSPDAVVLFRDGDPATPVTAPAAALAPVPPPLSRRSALADPIQLGNSVVQIDTSSPSRIRVVISGTPQASDMSSIVLIG